MVEGESVLCWKFVDRLGYKILVFPGYIAALSALVQVCQTERFCIKCERYTKCFVKGFWCGYGVSVL